MDLGADGKLRLSAQRALLGAVTPGLRSFSLELRSGVIHTLAVYADEPSELETDLIQSATTEIVADYVVETIAEQIVVSSQLPPPRLANLVFERHEPQD
ncbi:hypothetical protein BH10PSE2_BH10PSE2_02290 [soil metagenome]